MNHCTNDDSIYAATPLLEAKKLLLAKCADQPTINGVSQTLSFVDIRKMYFGAIPKRNVFVKMPKELSLPSKRGTAQVRGIYGNRDAGALWEDTYKDAIEAMGYRSSTCIASPRIFAHPGHDLTCMVHGDHFTNLASDENLDGFEKTLVETFELKPRGRLGVGCHGESDIRILNQITYSGRRAAK